MVPPELLKRREKGGQVAARGAAMVAEVATAARADTAWPEPWKKLAEMLPRRPSCAHLR